MRIVQQLRRCLSKALDLLLYSLRREEPYIAVTESTGVKFTKPSKIKEALSLTLCRILLKTVPANISERTFSLF